MRLHVVLPRSTIFDNDNNFYLDSKQLLISLHNKGYDLLLISHSTYKHEQLNKKIKEATNLDITFKTRDTLRKLFQKEKNKPLLKTTIVIGSSDEDLHLATNFKLLLINPGWSYIQDSKPLKYGLTLDSPKKAIQMLAIIENQQNWYFKLEIDEMTDLYALTSANNNSATNEESLVIDGFREFLKHGDRNYYEALFFHFISGVMKSDDLRNIQLWAIMPSSGSTLNSDMIELKERCRYLTGRYHTEPLFIRHTPVKKSHNTRFNERLLVGASKHLDSININPFYKGKLKGKTVCILDDYVTNGISFESLKNLLIAAGVEKIIFVAVGRFRKAPYGIYQKENYTISGDIFSPNYTYELTFKDSSYGDNATYYLESKTEVENIYNILNS